MATGNGQQEQDAMPHHISGSLILKPSRKNLIPKMNTSERWAGNYGKTGYPEKIVDHDFARQRAIAAYKAGIKKRIL